MMDEFPNYDKIKPSEAVVISGEPMHKGFLELYRRGKITRLIICENYDALINYKIRKAREQSDE